MLKDIVSSSIILAFNNKNELTKIKSFWDHSFIVGLTDVVTMFQIQIIYNKIILWHKYKADDELKIDIVKEETYITEQEREQIIQKYIEYVYEYIKQDL